MNQTHQIKLLKEQLAAETKRGDALTSLLDKGLYNCGLSRLGLTIVGKVDMLVYAERNKTNIRDAEDYEASFWDWAFLNECFAPTNGRVTDIDGLIERNGKFLIIETKKPGAKIPQGQQILFDHMRGTGIMTVLIIWGAPNKPEKAEVVTRKWNHIIEGDDVEGRIKRLVRRWFKWVNYDLAEQDNGFAK